MRLLAAKVVDRSMLLVATFALVAQQHAFPSAQFWATSSARRNFIVSGLLLAVATFGALTPVQSLAERSHVVRSAALRQQVLNHFGRLLILAGNGKPPISPTDLGLHVWQIRRSWTSRPWQRLTRVATYRLGAAPATRAFEPAIGVGVVGLCWKRNEEVAVDVAALAQRLQTQREFEAYASEHGADAVMGLSWAEFTRIRHRGAVFASPIRDGHGDFVGCVSLDAGRAFDVLLSDELWHELNSLCLTLGQDGLRHV